ncbi:hypothetical protein IT6_00850 [Methylacidiphilum caldifontis]|uniref:hypothetical protein n=1 Tax=Methylacidiphilum caldifontis TaxID=2795386 RepID=UPI001A8F2D1A|nr:hypothetical protein [Methylacidiphilum caldifontis]QSR88890.1 hypothetical protein IT6_00850 [Methylacidiphilum caldifontis]
MTSFPSYSFYIPSAPYSALNQNRGRDRDEKGFPVTKSVRLINEKDTFLGLEGPLIFVPALVFLIVHNHTHHFYLSTACFIGTYLFIKIFLSDKPPHFLRFIIDYLRIPKIYEHRFFNIHHSYQPLYLFEEELPQQEET